MISCGVRTLLVIKTKKKKLFCVVVLVLDLDALDYWRVIVPTPTVIYADMFGNTAI